MQVIAEDVAKEIKLEDEVVVIKKQSGQDQQEIHKVKDEIEAGIESILRSVIKWSFKNAAGQPLAITKENILKLRADLLILLAVEIRTFNLPLEIKKG